MFATTNHKLISMKRLLPLGLATMGMLSAALSHGAAPGITSTGALAAGNFSLTAQPAYLTQPDGQAVYSWGYGCSAQPAAGAFVPAMPNTTPSCGTMQVPGPTLVVTEGQTITVTLTNNLPAAAGNTSILFPGFDVSTSCGTAVNGLLTCEATPGKQVTYTFKASKPGTHSYYSGTQGDLQVEMGMYGAIIVLPSAAVSNDDTSTTAVACTDSLAPAGNNKAARGTWKEADFRLSTSAYDHPATCYDREYLFQFAEMDPAIHEAARQQVAANVASLNVPTEPYHPAYFLINGRSMPDDMDPNYAPMYPNQPYNGNPHMHPGEITLLRIIGQGRWQHPFHEHANHVRILARDGNLLLNGSNTLAGPLMFTTTTTPGMAMDGLFYYSGKGLNWDMYGHNTSSSDANAVLPCHPDANGYNSGATGAINYMEWCADHNKPMEASPFGDVPSGGPMTLPNSNILLNGNWYGGSPYLGPDATARATFGTCSGVNTTTNCSSTGTTPPAGTVANNPNAEAGYAFMWHSHNEREITTNNIFPGGMMMMMLVDSREFVIDESQ